MKRLRLWIALILTAGFAASAAEIRVAFGLKLGGTLDGVETVLKKSPGETREFLYVPTNGIAPFTHYTAKITPKTRMIYAIVAEAFEPGAVEKLGHLRTLLENKYGDPQRPNRWIQERRSILLEKRTPLDGLRLTYLDVKLEELARIEAEEMEREKLEASIREADISGL